MRNGVAIQTSNYDWDNANSTIVLRAHMDMNVSTIVVA